ncbi:voltage-gated ion channel superfamily, putative, partial [Bodo saltans]
MSSLEMILYIIGHGFLASEKFGRTAPQLRVLAVLGVWSPPRFRRKGDIAVQHYQVQLPLLSNSFMRLELCLVILSIVGYFLDFDGFGRVRFVHILRCARLIYGLSNIWPLMVRVIATFQSALSGMATALVLLVFFFILFGITGVDQFTNSLSNRCVLDPIPKPYSSYNRSEICLDGVGGGGCVEANPSLNCDIAGQNISFTAPFLCRGNMVCRTLDPPNFGYTSYNDFFHASLLMIQLTSLSDWGTFLYGVWMSNPQIIIGIYNAAVIIIVSYVVLNFVVATICSAYS